MAGKITAKRKISLKKTFRTDAVQRLEDRIADARRLIAIHEECTGQARGRRHGYEVLNRSAIVLSVAAWEGYIEDLFADAVVYLADNVRSQNSMPNTAVRYMVGKLHEEKKWTALTATTIEDIWSLAGRGWRTTYKSFGTAKIKSLNTPDPKNINKLARNILGLNDVSSNWRAGRWTPAIYSDRLSKILQLRHRIAHGEMGKETVGKQKARNAIDTIERLASWTHSRVRAHIRSFKQA